jgi:hypothetical protein
VQGFVTATQKLNRRAIREHWKTEIQKTFKSEMNGSA